MKSAWMHWGTWFDRAAGRRQQAQATRAGVADDELPVAPEKPWGCGWFDSSLDLRQGLAVIEHRGLPLELAVQAMVAPETAPS